MIKYIGEQRLKSRENINRNERQQKQAHVQGPLALLLPVDGFLWHLFMPKC